MISTFSIVFAIAAGIAMALTNQIDTGQADVDWYRRALWLIAGVCIQGRLIANLLDGMVAIEGGKASPVGELYNEVPDRISDVAIFIGAGLAVGGRLDLGLTTGVVAVYVAYIRAMGTSVGVGQVFLGPMAKPHRMALMTATCAVCAILPISWQPIHTATGIGIVGVSLVLVIVGGAVTSVRRLRRIGLLMRQRAAASEAANV
ncbi:CDP-alcohol phosphatidyltransferase family protein [Stieleria marina]